MPPDMNKLRPMQEILVILHVFTVYSSLTKLGTSVPEPFYKLLGKNVMYPGK